MKQNFEDLKSLDICKVDNMRGGEGSCTLYKLKDIPEDYIMIAKIYVHKGASIGYHVHIGSSETIFIISGQGKVIDDGQELSLNEGDLHICYNNHSHSVVNTGDEDLVLYGIVKKES